MIKKAGLIWCLLIAGAFAVAQTPKGMTMEQYDKAKTFIIKDLDNDTYVKFDNTYVLDRYEGRKPYFVTGDDGLKKRIDLYTLSLKADGSMLGTVIYYTNEKGRLYIACLPGISSDAKIWNKYFEDIHAIDAEEKYFVLKLSYILSKEYSFQQYKSSLKGKEIDRSEAGTYGTDICFPGDEEVAMANGEKKLLSNVEPGDKIISIDPVSHMPAVVKVRMLQVHEAKNYAITRLTLLHATKRLTLAGYDVQLFSRQLEATPNHPVTTNTGVKNIGAVNEGEEVICRNMKTGNYEAFTVWEKTEITKGVQKVYNIDADAGSTFIINGVMVMQKQISNKQ